MKLLMIGLNQVGQGTYWRAFHLGRTLTRLGVSVTLIATSRQRRAGIRVRTLEGITLVETPDLFSGPLRSGWDPWNTLNRLAWLRNQEFDLVHAFESRPTVIIPAYYLARRKHISLVMDWCDWFGRGGSVEERPNWLIRTILRPVETFFEERFRNQADGTTVICSLLRKKAEALGVPAESILDLPNGADTQHLRPLSRLEARAQINLGDQDFIAGYMGSIFKKDAEFMAQAFDLVSERIPNFKLVIVGKFPFDLRLMVKHPENIFMSGYVATDQLNTYLAACDVFWLPLSDSNANRGRFPLKLTDYLAVGRPVIATAVGDVTQILENGEAGLLSLPEPVAFAEQTERLFQQPELRNRLGEQARRLAETDYAWEKLAEKLLAYYQRVLALNETRSELGEPYEADPQT